MIESTELNRTNTFGHFNECMHYFDHKPLENNLKYVLYDLIRVFKEGKTR